MCPSVPDPGPGPVGTAERGGGELVVRAVGTARLQVPPERPGDAAELGPAADDPEVRRWADAVLFARLYGDPSSPVPWARRTSTRSPAGRDGPGAARRRRGRAARRAARRPGPAVGDDAAPPPTAGAP